MFFVVAVALTSQAGQPIPADKLKPATAIVDKTARALYGRWGRTAADDTAVLQEVVDLPLARAVAAQRQACAQGTGTCVDRLTCMAERADVERVVLLPTSTTALLQADVALKGATTGARATARWEIRVSATGSRVSDVRCPAPAPTLAPPTGTASSKQPKFQSKVKPKNARETAVIAYLQESTEAGQDARRIGDVLKKWYTPEGRASYIDHVKNVCLSLAKDGLKANEGCDGNSMTCTDEDVTLVSLEISETAMVTALLQTSSGLRRRVTLFLEDDPRRVLISSNSCASPDSAPSTPSSSLSPSLLDSTSTTPRRQGRCNGFATCNLSCTEAGCYRGTTGRCMGSPTPCSSRGQGSCFGSCYWSEQ